MPARLRLFRPIIAGATLRERLLACLGACVAMGLASLVTRHVFGGDLLRPLVAGPVAASAVLAFAVPSSPLAQPWPVFGGNLVGGAAGLLLAMALAPLEWSAPLVAALAVPAGIVAMSLLRCLHPPGGAMALTMGLAPGAGDGAALLTTLAPAALNIVVLLACAAAFHRLCGRSYPHRPAAAPPNPVGSADAPAAARGAPEPADIDAALASLGESFDINRDDLLRIFRQAQTTALARNDAGARCADIMSRDLISVSRDTPLAEARRLLLAHNVRALPVLEPAQRVAGVIGLREIAAAPDDAGSVGAAMTGAATAREDTPVNALLPALTDGRAHAVIIVDDNGRATGLVTQTDLLWAMARAAAR
ncbi:HPP family protein [Camelimonas abortus]|uniref:HPP family protein n=1 Tax=Camelimonas abortus TaxID=1017184 RepID=A0ABV7LB27_9HYPH